jgi:large subunit ribosomal protein L1
MAKATKQPIEEVELEAAAAAQAPITEPELTPQEPEDKQAAAKAGKRSEKALKEAEEKEAKEERKAKKAEAEAEADKKPKQTAKPTRTRLERQGKNFRKAAELIEKGKSYKLAEAVELATKTSPVKFDASVELHINLNVDPRHADQNIRDNLVLPAGTGKTVRIAVLDDTKVDNADISGVETILNALEKGQIDFDVLIATPAQMPKLGKYARLLGPRGLMPNPKSGTVTTDVKKAVAEAKSGRVEYRVDSTGIVHLAFGKVSFGPKKLEDNARAIFASIKAAKPASVKSGYVKAIHLATTMGPSITIDISEL